MTAPDHSLPADAPLVGVPCDRKQIGDQAFHAAGEKYLTALTDAARVQPVLIPVAPDRAPAVETLFAALDGLLMTGAPSNVHPDRYDGPAPRDGTALDPARDAVTLPLIRAAVARGLPLFAICRGFQEFNVAFGGTLHQHAHELPDAAGYAARIDHREPYGKPLEERYALRHEVTVEPDGQLERIIGQRTIRVNTLHSQGVDRLAEPLTLEARAADGFIEAARVTDAPAFALGVQWHPDWRPLETPHYAALFAAFGDAVRAHRDHRQQKERSR